MDNVHYYETKGLNLSVGEKAQIDSSSKYDEGKQLFLPSRKKVNILALH